MQIAVEKTFRTYLSMTYAVVMDKMNKNRILADFYLLRVFFLIFVRLVIDSIKHVLQMTIFGCFYCILVSFKLKQRTCLNNS